MKVRKYFGLMFVLTCFSLWAVSQANSAYKTGTIVEVKAHPGTSSKNQSLKQYDISVKVENTVYVVLFTPPPGSNVVEYKAGLDLPVLIDGNTMKFNDMTGRRVTLPILSRGNAEKKVNQ